MLGLPTAKWELPSCAMGVLLNSQTAFLAKAASTSDDALSSSGGKSYRTWNAHLRMSFPATATTSNFLSISGGSDCVCQPSKVGFQVILAALTSVTGDCLADIVCIQQRSQHMFSPALLKLGSTEHQCSLGCQWVFYSQRVLLTDGSEMLG